jgi:hypothetical protein
MRYLPILFLIILLVFISGCTNQNQNPTVSTEDGVSITDFSFNPSSVYAGYNAGLGLEFQNLGGSKAEITKIQIYGVDFTSGSSSTQREWRIVKGNQEVDIANGLTSKGELDPPEPDVGIEGDKDYYEWRLQSPLVTAKTDYDFRVRIEYSYTTVYTGIIRLVHEDYLESLSDADKQKLYNSDGIISSVSTNGPISVVPFSGRHFIVEELATKPILKFKIENVGKGYTYTDIGKYYLTIKETPGSMVSCGNQPIKLSSGKSTIIDCTFDPSLVGSFTNKIDKTFQINFEYSYYVDGITSITVNPSF